MTRRGEPPALHGRQVPAHAIHFGDVGAAAQERFAHLALVVECEPWRRIHEERGAAAGDEAQHEVVRCEACDLLSNPVCGVNARLVGHRMGCFHDLDALAGNGMSVPRYHEPFERTVEMLLDRAGHGRRRFSGADDDHASARPRGEMLRYAQRRLCGIHRRVEHPSQQLARRVHGLVRHALSVRVVKFSCPELRLRAPQAGRSPRTRMR